MVSVPLQEYLFLSHYSTLSDQKFSKLLSVFGDLTSILSSTSQEFVSQGVNPGLLNEFNRARRMANSNSEVQKALDWSAKDGNFIVCYEDSRYPQRLKEIDHAPTLLYVKGNPDLLSTNQIAIVGSRRASPYGLSNAFQLAKEASAVQLSVTSGLATGIDRRAHEGALNDTGRTIAVIGTGIEGCYPTKNYGVKQEIESNGAVVSEFALGSPPLAHHFPRRNRIITGLSLGVLVIEAAARSGSLVSARLAMEQNREVFAVPGLISNPQSAGCHQLIRQGAKLVESMADILEEFPHLDTNGADQITKASKNPASIDTDRQNAALNDPTQKKILRSLKSQPCLLDTLALETNIEINELIESLLLLESRGTISLESGRYHYCGR
ncbi:MAG: DNA processing protein [Pseudohongiellaceae bacterium]|jgi:DNA processing protein